MRPPTDHLRFVLLPSLGWLVFWCLGCSPSEEPTSPKQGTSTPLSTESKVPAGPKLLKMPDLYVGMEKCSECHVLQARHHAKTGHANTFLPAVRSPLSDQLAGQAIRDPKHPVTYHYSKSSNDLSVAIDDESFPLEYAFGSGRRAVTFLTLVNPPREETIGLEHRLSWIAELQNWQITPGQQDDPLGQGVERFARKIPAASVSKCVGCHTTTGTISGTEISNLRPNVNCESCHGPGREHVEAVEKGAGIGVIQFARSNRNPIKEIHMCGKCHRNTSDISPKSLKPTNKSLTRFQPVGLTQSQCFIQSGGGLSCSTCHDPHQSADDRSLVEYEAKCLSCHTPDQKTPQELPSVACSVSPRARCIECHMPKVEVHPGLRFHDHWIRIRRDAALDSSPAPRKDHD